MSSSFSKYSTTCTFGERLSFFLEIIDGIGLTGRLGLKLLQIAFQNAYFGVHALNFLFGPLLPLLGQLQHLEGLLEFLLEVGNGLRIFLGHLECKPEFGGLVGDVPGEFCDFIVEDAFVIVTAPESPVESVVLMFEADK